MTINPSSMKSNYKLYKLDFYFTNILHTCIIDSIFVPRASGSWVFYCDKYDQSKTWILQNVYKPQLGEITDYKIIFAKNIRQLT